MNFKITVLDDPESIANKVAEEVLAVVKSAVESRGSAELVLTGGTLGIAVLESMRNASLVTEIDWRNVHVWWGDERFVEIDSLERNDLQAVNALLRHISIPASNIHFPETTTNCVSVDKAATDYEADLLEHFGSKKTIYFDALLLGIGPDGHIASLFPGQETLDSKSLVVAVTNSPKPPPERISFSFKTITKANKIWAFASGAGKAEAINKALNGAQKHEIPLVGVFALDEQYLYLDKELAANTSTFPLD
ncbi:MAG: 6-phosphogluconolactonase [Microbacteriaceae bacterium]|nr:6-phosphogluconolactonase [Microbacteriaceae bacterium]